MLKWSNMQLKETSRARRPVHTRSSIPWSRCWLCCGDSRIAPPVGSLVTNEREGLLCAVYSALIFVAGFAKFYAPTFSGPPLTLSLIDRVGYSPKFSLPMLYFVDSPKFYAANVLRYTVASYIVLFLYITIYVYIPSNGLYTHHTP